MLPSKPPPELKRWPKWFRSVFNALREFAIRESIYSVVMTGAGAPSFIKTQHGKILKIPKTTATAVVSSPFQLINAGNAIDGPRVRVRYGTVNSEIPDGMVAGDVTPFYIDVADEDFVYLHVTTDGDGIITDVEILAGSPIPDDADPEFYFQIGSVSVDGDDVTPAQAISGSQAFQRCQGFGLWGLV